MAVSAILLPCAALMALGAGGAKAVKRAAEKKAAVKTVAAPPESAAPVSFREEVEPFLKANCASCHSADKHTSGFALETTTGLFAGGQKYGVKVIIPGNAKESAMVSYLRGKISPRMPLAAPAADAAQIVKLEAWINQGAKIDAVKLGYPYTPPVAYAVPKVKNSAWVKNPIDAFVLAKLESKGLRPAAPAPKIALLRRVYADLIGENPTPEEADAFLNDAAPDAYPKLVDKLLADPRYGERWARHWLDLVRYADSEGFEHDDSRPHAWRFRDYVIRAFNSDKPYDRFLKEQLAGDELYPNDADAQTATGYARLAPWDGLSTDHEQRWQDFLNDVTDTTGSVMLGLTVGCARCHNHKYDRITQADYYRTQAFFTNIQWVEPTLPENRQELAGVAAKYAEFTGKLAALRKAAEAENDKQKKNEIEAQVREMRQRMSPYDPQADSITDKGATAAKAFLLKRGDLHTPGQEMQPGFVAALAGGQDGPAPIVPPANGKTTGRRSALANWIASPANPMTARVMVNRLWQRHLGRGIVGTPSDFGVNGDRATHKELLDWLALRFVDGGWSMKKMHRLMLLSNAYQMSTAGNPEAEKLDPQNRLLWRMNRIRLEGEAVRDSILTVSGRLNPEMGGPGIYPHLSEEVLSTGSTHKWGSSTEDQQRRRTIYVFQRRSLALPIVEAFDGPDTVNTCPRRSTTTIAPQALALFNGEFTRTEARYFAERVVKEAGADAEKQIERAYKIALIRRPTVAQKALALQFLQNQTRLYRNGGRNPDAKTAAALSEKFDAKQAQMAPLLALTDLCHVLINTNEFIYMD